ncbi:hypothetical protein CGMCC3_g5056 [Colletotrichum fructicola]|nr:uncharacterized protein CGMCC3_g5056 [Colletotrichum fructicola]KAE9578724.1 hypothetical protein CGMCC3_g5056 [Colletotrichum fructicola]
MVSALRTHLFLNKAPAHVPGGPTAACTGTDCMCGFLSFPTYFPSQASREK